MAQYEAVPREETPSNEAMPPHEDDGNPSGSKKTAQVYVQVPSDESNRSQQSEQHAENRCVHPFLLSGLAFVFAGCSLTIGLLYHFSKIKNGLTTEKETRRYAWIYGPTSVIVLIRVVWRIIDLKVKQSMPWHELANGPASADKTILLEYISHTIGGNIWRSIKNRHWAVTTTILGNLTCLLMIVFATGLFSLQSTLVSRQGILLTGNQLNGSAYNSSAVGASPALLSFAIQGKNLSYPQGTTGDTLVPLFKPTEPYPEDSTYDAYVNGLNVSIDCEVLNITNATKTYLPWWSLGAPYFLSNISTSDCELLNVPIGMGSGGMVMTMNNTQTYSANINQYVCNSGMDYSTPESRGQLVYGEDETDLIEYYATLNRSLDSRIFISIIDFHFPPNTQSEIPGIWIHNLTTVLCKPTYSINSYHVEYFQNSTDSKIELVNENGNHLPGLYPGDISRGVENVFSDYESMYLGMGGTDFILSDAVPPFFQIIGSIHGGEKRNFTLKNLLEPKVLKSSVESLVTGTAIQLLHMNIMTETLDSGNVAFEGNSTYVEQRLHVKAISTGFLCGGFALMAVWCLMLIFLVPRKISTEEEIGSTGIVVNTLESNPKLTDNFRDGNSSVVMSRLRYRKYVSHRPSGTDAVAIDVVTPSVATKARTAQSPAPAEKTRISPPPQWWYPASAQVWFTAVAVVLALVLIGSLEGIQHLSDRNMGFVEIRSLNVSTTVLAQYVPAAIALGVNLMFGSIELIVAATAPFATLKKGSAIPSRSLALDYLTKSGPHNFILSIINRHLALTVILTTTLVSSFLSVVIPGLYSHFTLPSKANVIVLQQDRFDPLGVDISFDDKYAASMLNLLTYYGVEYSNWVFEDLAIPQLSVPSIAIDQKHAESSSTTLSLRTDAIRAVLRCEPVLTRTRWVAEPQHKSTWSRGRSDWITITSLMELPWSLCSNPPKNASADASITWVQTFLASNNTVPGDKIHVGKSDILKWDETLDENYKGDLTTGGDGTKESRTGAGLDPQYIMLADWGCPSLAFTLGTIVFQADPQNTTTILMNPYMKNETYLWNNLTVDSDIATLVCSQNVQTVKTNITLEYPDLSISAHTPPQPDELTVQWLKDTISAEDGTTFQFVPNSMLLSLNNPNGSLSDPWRDTDDADRFTQALVYVAQKEENMSLYDLSGMDNVANLEKIAQKLYGRYMAQAFSSNMRVSIDHNTTNITLTDAPWTPRSSNLTSGLNARSRSPYPAQLKSIERRENTYPVIPAILTQTGARTRIVQNKSPKIALQAMLGFMVIGAIVTKCLLRTKELLPHEPYSIAGRAILVANGNILQGITNGQEKNGRAQKYRLGWWTDKDGKERYGICIQE